MNKCYLIDDDKIFNLISSKMIERSGWDCDLVVFNSAELALNEIVNNINTPELLPHTILLDIRMPDMDGISFLQRIVLLPESFTENLKVYVLSSSLDERDSQASFQFPVVKGFLNKPLSIHDLNSIIN